jgi:hypothetical protein
VSSSFSLPTPAVQILLAPVQEADHGHNGLGNTYQKRCQRHSETVSFPVPNGRESRVTPNVGDPRSLAWSCHRQRQRPKSHAFGMGSG